MEKGEKALRDIARSQKNIAQLRAEIAAMKSLALQTFTVDSLAADAGSIPGQRSDVSEVQRTDKP